VIQLRNDNAAKLHPLFSNEPMVGLSYLVEEATSSREKLISVVEIRSK